ncbi:MAG: RecX family transcriptional regulator [Bacteroidetes bacterium]|nr:RecX family transcriptional regulator [Bacteroidota bacterium]
MQKQKLTAEQALQKARHYCAYQERSHFEVKEKLYSFGLFKTEVEQLLSNLIEEDYLNEERFTKQFAGGKFRLKQWGKIKIEHELKQKKVSSYNIKKALKEIDEDEYLKVLQNLTQKKWSSLKAEQYLNRITKTTNYLLQKGYEYALINNAIKHLRNK